MGKEMMMVRGKEAMWIGATICMLFGSNSNVDPGCSNSNDVWESVSMQISSMNLIWLLTMYLQFWQFTWHGKDIIYFFLSLSLVLLTGCSAATGILSFSAAAFFGVYSRQSSMYIPDVQVTDKHRMWIQKLICFIECLNCYVSSIWCAKTSEHMCELHRFESMCTRTAAVAQ